MHSLKGAAGMFGIMDLQDHMHTIETQFEKFKNVGSIEQNEIDYFLQAIDKAKALLNSEECDFGFWDLSDFSSLSISKEKKITPQKTITPEKSNVVFFDEEKVKQSEKVEKRKDELKLKKRSRDGVVFIVDDEPDVLFLLEDILTDDGYEIKTFGTASELLKELEKTSPDVILSDINMPEMSGVEMVKEMSCQDVSIPVIFISAYVTKEVMLEALEYGGFSFIEKPFDPLKVRNSTENAVLKSQLSRLVDRSINYILYQFSDLDDYLVKNDKQMVRDSLKEELEILLSKRKELKKMGA